MKLVGQKINKENVNVSTFLSLWLVSESNLDLSLGRRKAKSWINVEILVYDIAFLDFSLCRVFLESSRYFIL